jgi:hypothetical protein
MARSAVCEVPVLGRRRHLRPERGGCLVEIASTLPGGRWTDRPACVDPVLAAMARGVNDRTSDAGQGGLLVLAPWLVTGGQVSADCAAMALGRLAGQTVLAGADGTESVRLATQIARLGPGSDPPFWAGWLRWRRQRRATALVRRAVRPLARGPDPDAALRALLVDAVNVMRRLEGLPPVVVDDTTGTGWPATLPVRVELRVPDGADSLYFHCTALTDRWPAPLGQAWQDRARELGTPHQQELAAAPA